MPVLSILQSLFLHYREEALGVPVPRRSDASDSDGARASETEPADEPVSPTVAPQPPPAAGLLTAAAATTYGWVPEGANVQLIWGLGPSIPHTVALLRAHELTGDDRFRDQAVANGQ